MLLLLLKTADPAAQGCADYPSRAGATMTIVTLSDDDEASSGLRLGTSFVETYLGDGIKLGDGVLEIRSRSERRVAPPGIQKVRLSWATAFLRQG